MFHAASRGLCCEPCRTRHYKCDEKVPKCGRCSRTGRRCVRSNNIRFRPVSGDGEFPSNQIWLRFPSRVEFVDETEELVQGTYEVPAFPSVQRVQPLPLEHSDALTPGVEGLTASFDPQAFSPHGLVDTPESSEVEQSSQNPAGLNGSASVPLSINSTAAPRESPSLTSISHRRSWSGISPLTESRQTLVVGSAWPLHNPQEAFLLQYFVDRISCFFDFCDRERHFAIEVPQRARECRTLFNAVLALSARHISRTSDFDPFVSDHYYQECLKTLIPALDDRDATMDENLLAATVVLRLLEELDVPLVGSDMQGHSIGTQSFIRAQEESPMAPGLRQAAYWAGVRQEIYISLTLQRSPAIHPNPQLCSTDRSLLPTDDCTWANRAIVHCADVLEFSFGDGPRSLTGYNSLKEFNTQWRNCRPPSFDPFFSNENESSENEDFPDVRLHADWHVMGTQYLTLAHILLLVYDPSIPRVGPAHRKAIRMVDHNVKRDVRRLCGIGLSNPSTPPAILVACMAINLCGDRFIQHHEQRKLLEILIKTEKIHGWPTTNMQHSLREIWGRDEIG